MANIFEIKANKNGTATITQNAYVHFCTLDAMRKAVEGVNGKIGKTKDGMLKATVASVKDAEACERKVARGLAKARKAKTTEENKATSRTIKNAPTPAKGKSNLVTVTVDGVSYTVDKANLVPTAPKSEPAKKTAPKRAKGNGFDFGKIKGKTNTDKNKALHAVLVGMGMKDSRAKDYQAIWTNRPWAK